MTGASESSARPIRCCVVVAMRCEAAPIVEALGLERCAADGTQLASPESASGKAKDFVSDGVRLRVCGIGEDAAARAVEDLGEEAASASDSPVGWLNFGVAGSGDLPLGSGHWADRVIDESRPGSEVLYPSLSLFPRATSAALRTVREVERGYGEAGLYDMEGSAFFRSAARRSTLELVQCYKVVSDGPEAPVDRLDANRISELIRAQRAEIVELVRTLAETAASLGRHGEEAQAIADGLLANHHFSVTRRRQLLSWISRCLAFAPAAELERSIPSDLRDAKHCLELFESLLGDLGGNRIVGVRPDGGRAASERTP